MAKLSKLTAEIMAQREDVRRVRARYAQALQRGFSTIEAAKFAQGDGVIGQINPAPAPIVSNDAGETAQTAQLSGHGIHRDNIPPNWQDLPWPQLKGLADALRGKDVKSRKMANEVIENALAGEL